MKLSFSHYLLSCLLHEIDDSFNKLDITTQFHSLSWFYAQFEVSKYDDDNKTEEQCLREYLEAREKFKTLLSTHDFTHDYSDDHRAYKRGAEQLKIIKLASSLFSEVDWKTMWNEYAPETLKK